MTYEEIIYMLLGILGIYVVAGILSESRYYAVFAVILSVQREYFVMRRQIENA